MSILSALVGTSIVAAQAKEVDDNILILTWTTYKHSMNVRLVMTSLQRSIENEGRSMCSIGEETLYPTLSTAMVI